MPGDLQTHPEPNLMETIAVIDFETTGLWPDAGALIARRSPRSPVEPILDPPLSRGR